MRRDAYRMVAVFLLAALMLLPRVEAAQTQDMYGRSVSLPDRITKVVGASPGVTYMLYTIDPELVGGLNLPPNAKLARYLGREIAELPVVGGFGGAGGNINREVFLTIRPDLVVAWPPHSRSLNPKVQHVLDSAGVPYALLKLDRIADYPQAYEYLGKLLGRPARARQLAARFRHEMQKLQAAVADIPEDERVSVYFAQGVDGLTTVASGSVHSEALALAGGRNVWRQQAGHLRYKPRVSIEQVLALDPEVIIVQDASFFNQIYRADRWRGMRAVRNKKVFLEPCTPFNWMDKPPSFMGLLGAKWLAGILYPEQGQARVVSETRALFKLFLGKTLDDGDMRSLLNGYPQASNRRASAE